MSKVLLVTLSTALLAIASPIGQELGTITFPNSGNAAAQASFIEGVKGLHSFQFDEAAVAFQRAQKADPTFAMAYWGEAMSHNHPLWAQQDAEAAKKILEKIAPTSDARQAKATLPKEKAFLKAIDILYYSPGDKLARDIAYSEALASMYAQWPADHEVATWYALSLLGTVRPTDKGFRRQALAASIAEKVFAENPKHPGAAHFIIHAFDDPDHAPLGLTAARCVRGHRAGGGARAAYAVAHLRAARHVGGRPQVEHRRLQVGDRAQRADEARRRARGLPHARLARIRELDARQHRRSEGQRRIGQAGRGRVTPATPASTTATSACARD